MKKRHYALIALLFLISLAMMRSNLTPFEVVEYLLGAAFWSVFLVWLSVQVVGDITSDTP